MADNHTWSDQQQKIFGWFAKSSPVNSDHLVVRARAGTGKTTTIIEGIKHAPESSILLAAFNKRIATELEVRLEGTNAEAKTLHSIGFSFLRRYWSSIGVEKRNGTRQLTLAEQVCGTRAPESVIKLVGTLHTKGREIVPHADTVGDLTDLAYQFDCVPDESWCRDGFGVEYVETRALEAMELAARVKPVGTGIDFSDMIYLPIRNQWLTKRWDLVVVDEAQDMTEAQLEIAQKVCRGRICVVGDDRQAIYGFRGADSESLDRLKAELHADELGLTTTYRCGTTIVNAAKALVDDFEAGPSNPEGSITEMDPEEMKRQVDIGDFILSRVNAPLVSIALALLAKGKRTLIAGRDVGAGLKKLIRTLAKGAAAQSIPRLLERISVWEEKQCDRMIRAKKPERCDLIHDQAECLVALCSDATSVWAITQRIDALFTDNGLGQAGTITCSSVHKSKGLEADRVFILRDTLKEHNQEELNIQYVAITRAKSKLVWVFED
tara:strand:- start:3966 stop:5447 length:1482 start_codon:yes stop_codon:yes gene_type:complete